MPEPKLRLADPVFFKVATDPPSNRVCMLGTLSSIPNKGEGNYKSGGLKYKVRLQYVKSEVIEVRSSSHPRGGKYIFIPY